MLDILEVRNSQDVPLIMPLHEVETGYLIESITGLEPVNAVLVSSSFATIDGAQFQSSRRETRNIVIRVGLEPDFAVETVADLRGRLYTFFMPRSEVSLRFRTDEGDAFDILGRVESFESVLFAAEPAVDISIVCFDPDFFDPDVIEFDWGTTAGPAEAIVPYAGTIETGFLFTLLVNRPISAFTIYHRPPDGSLRSLNFAYPMNNGDVLTINTEQGKKSVLLRQNNVERTVLYAMAPQSNWLELQPGDNRIRVYAEGADIPYNIRYSTKYGGL